MTERAMDVAQREIHKLREQIQKLSEELNDAKKSNASMRVAIRDLSEQLSDVVAVVGAWENFTNAMECALVSRREKR